LQLRLSVPAATWGAGAQRLPAQEEVEMRIVETAAAGIIAIASQILMVAVVFI
jgi:hypothetical protein